MTITLVNKILIGQKAIKELGFSKVVNFSFYKLLFKSGYYRLRCPSRPSALLFPDSISSLPDSSNYSPFSIPTKFSIERSLGNNKAALILTSDEIVAGNWRFYGDVLQPLHFSPLQSDMHWSQIQDQPETETDLKDIWESARFCWVYPLGRAYVLTGDERYPEAFLDHYTKFSDHNPVNSGLNWMSAQEVALRLIAFSFAIQAFKDSPHFTESIRKGILESIYQHARRIPPTISYSRAQNNNHLLSEAAGLIIAGIVLKGVKPADQFRKMGWRLFNEGIEKQIDCDGLYVQQSTNYHRLMLHLAILVVQTAKNARYEVPQSIINKLQLATQWLYGMVDEISGFAPNLGHNDGSNILPLTQLSFHDYRPTLQSASLCFFNKPVYEPGPWDELSLWLGLLPNDHLDDSGVDNVPDKFTHPSTRLGSSQSWGSLRAVHFRDRPAHADQLHVELWWHGHNLALDPGTYRYSAPKPWANALANTSSHNTITINNMNQMIRAGRFLWLDWAHGRIISRSEEMHAIKAEHSGYRKLGITHRRELSALGDSNWIIRDEIMRKRDLDQSMWITLHWLIPDGKWNFANGILNLENVAYKISLSIEPFDKKKNKIQPSDRDFQVIRCGAVLFGKNESHPNLGWFSPTYGSKVPALSFRYNIQTGSEISIISRWEILPSDAQHHHQMG